MRLYLTGYMGTGKSTLGRKIAKRTELPFFDTDKMVEEAEGAEVADIITYAGESYFREAERRALEQTAEVENAVISTGGGLPMWGDNQAWIAELNNLDSFLCAMLHTGKSHNQHLYFADNLA